MDAEEEEEIHIGLSSEEEEVNNKVNSEEEEESENNLSSEEEEEEEETVEVIIEEKPEEVIVMSANSKVRMLPIQKYSGDPNKFADFMAEYYRVAKVFEWTPEQMIARIILSLEGLAEKVRSRIPPVTNQTWEEFVTSFRNKLIIGDHTQSQLRTLRKRMKGANENVMTYAYAIRTLAEQGLPDIKADARDQIILSQFLEGLPADMRKHIIMAEVKTLDEALTKATLYEQYDDKRSVNVVEWETDEGEIEKPKKSYEKTYEKSPGFRDSGREQNRSSRENSWDRNLRGRRSAEASPNREYRGRSPSNYGEGSRNNRGYSQRGTHSNQGYTNQQGQPWRNGRSGKPLICYNCGKMGHPARLCRGQRTGPRSQPGDRNQAGYVPRDNVNQFGMTQCFNCKQNGHMARSCPLLQGNMFTRQSNSRENSPARRVSFSKPEAKEVAAEEDDRDEQIRRLQAELSDEKRRRLRERNPDKEEKRKGKKSTVSTTGGLEEGSRGQKLYTYMERLMKLKKMHDDDKVLAILKEIKSQKLTEGELEDLMPAIRAYRHQKHKIGKICKELMKRYFQKVLRRDPAGIFKCRINMFDKITLDFKFPVIVTVEHLLKRVAKEIHSRNIHNWEARDIDKLRLANEETVLACGCTKKGVNYIYVTFDYKPEVVKEEIEGDTSESDKSDKSSDNTSGSDMSEESDNNTQNSSTESDSEELNDEDNDDDESNSLSGNATDRTTKSGITDTESGNITTDDDDEECSNRQISALDTDMDKEQEDEEDVFLREAYRVLRLENAATDAIGNILRQIAEKKISIQGIETLLPMILTHAGEGKTHETIVRNILHKHGNALRKHPDRKQMLNLVVHIDNQEMTRRYDYHPHAKVKRLREDIKSTLEESQAEVVLTVHGYRIQDHEYLMECGCYPNRTVHIQARILGGRDIMLETPPLPRTATPEYHYEEVGIPGPTILTPNQYDEHLTQIWNNAQKSDSIQEQPGPSYNRQETVNDIPNEPLENDDEESQQILGRIINDDRQEEENMYPEQTEFESSDHRQSDGQTQTSPPLKRARGRPRKNRDKPSTLTGPCTSAEIRRQSKERARKQDDAEQPMKITTLKLKEVSRKREEEVTRHSDETYKILTSILKMRRRGLSPKSMKSVLTPLYQEIEECMTYIQATIPRRPFKMIKEITDGKIIKDLVRNNVTFAKVMMAMTYLVEALEKQRPKAEILEQALQEAVKIVNRHISPYIQEQGGWKKFMEKRISKTEDNETDEDSTGYETTEDPQGEQPRPGRTWMQELRQKIPSLSQTKLSTLLMVILATILRIPQTNTILAYDCTKPQIGHYYSLLDTETCPEAIPNRFRESGPVVYNIYQESDFLRATVQECLVKKSTTVWNCGHNSWSSIILPTTPFEPINVTPENCRFAFQTGKITIDKHVSVIAKRSTIIHQRINRVGEISQNGACSGEGLWQIGSQIHKYAIVIEDYQTELREYKAAFDEEGRMMDRSYCSSKEPSCATGESILVYNVPTNECRMVLLKSLPFKVLTGTNFENKDAHEKNDHVNGKMKIPRISTPTVLVTADPADAIRLILKGDTAKCSEKVTKTDYEGIFVTTRTIVNARAKLDKTDIKLQHYFNNKMSYMYHHGLMQMEKFYQETIANDCKLNREIIKTKLAVVMTNPDAITPLLPLEAGTFARVMGEVLYTYKCTQVDVTIRHSDLCTTELPIMFKGKEAYLSPVTRVIIHENMGIKPLNCSNVMSPMYELKPGHWITLPSRTRIPPPRQLELIKLNHTQSFEPLQDVEKGGIYVEKDIEDARRFILFPEKRARILTEMVYTVSGGQPGGTNFELLLPEDHFRKATHNTMKKIWGKFLIFGQMFAGLMGVYCIIICIKIVLSQVLSTYHIYRLKGFTWKLITGIFPFLAKHVILHHHQNILRSMQAERRYENDPDGKSWREPPVYKNHKAPIYSVIPDAPEMEKHNGKKKKAKSIHSEPSVSQVWDMSPLQNTNCHAVHPHTSSNNAEEERLQLQRQAKQALYVQEKEFQRQNGIFKMIHGAGTLSPRSRIVINERIMTAIWDTGAPISIIHEKFLTEKELHNKGPIRDKYWSLTGQTLDIIGRIWALFSLEEEHQLTQLFITTSDNIECILGMDTILPMHASGVEWMHNSNIGELQVLEQKVEAVETDAFKEELERRCKEKTTERTQMPRRRRGTLKEDKEITISLIRQSLRIDGREIEAIMDTGCTTSAIRISELSEHQKSRIKQDKKRCKSVTGQVIVTCGVLEVEISILGYQVTRTVRVLKQSDMKCIIGLDIIQELEKRGLKWMKTDRQKRSISDYLMPLTEESEGVTKELFGELPNWIGGSTDETAERKRDNKDPWETRRARRKRASNGQGKEDRIEYWSKARIQDNKKSFDTRKRIGYTRKEETCDQDAKSHTNEEIDIRRWFAETDICIHERCYDSYEESSHSDEEQYQKYEESLQSTGSKEEDEVPWNRNKLSLDHLNELEYKIKKLEQQTQRKMRQHQSTIDGWKKEIERIKGELIKSNADDATSNKIFSEVARIGHDYAFGKRPEDFFTRITEQLPVVFTLSDDVGDSPLNNAILQGNIGRAEHIVEILEKCQWSLNETNTSGHTALMLATACNAPASFVRKLLDAGCELEKYDSDGKSALTYAIEYQNTTALEVLTQYIKENNMIEFMKKQESSSLSYLHIATMTGYKKGIELLTRLQNEEGTYMVNTNEELS